MGGLAMPDEGAAGLARRLSVDALAAEVVDSLEAIGVRAVLLKGPAVASWLYAPGERTYSDVDLMVAGGDLAHAHAVLVERGFGPVVSYDAVPAPSLDPTAGLWDELGCHAITYHRAEGMPGWVDLHRTLWSTPATVWNVLSDRTDRLHVGGRELEVPVLAGRALIVALHALQHWVANPDAPPAGKALEDLRRAVTGADLALWRETALMAASIGAEIQLAGALRLVSGGQELAARLGLPVGEAADAATRALLVMRVSRYERLALTTDLRARVRLVTRALFPSRVLIRLCYPRARRGRVGLAIAYASWLSMVIRRAPSGIRAWHDARADMQAASSPSRTAER
jgi:Uncharacterised nucleotidyltransferase